MEVRNSPFSSSNNEQDRISYLPDSLIHYILSFIDMSYAVKTSILSRRWRYIWTSLPTLNFDTGLLTRSVPDMEVKPEEIRRFIDFVERVLYLRESSDIKRFELYCGDIDTDIINGHIYTWIIAVVRRNVQELDICMTGFMEDNFEIPHCLFTCKSLTKLEITIGREDAECKVNLPANSMSLPRLKSLRLESLQFEDERLANMLFSSCAALESLVIHGCVFYNMNLYISSPTLKHFEFFCYDGLNLRNDPRIDGKVKLYAPKLTSFICDDYMSQDYCLENLSSLVNADINMKVEEKENSDQMVGRYSKLTTEEIELYAQCMMKMLKALHNVKVLTLSAQFIEFVSRAPGILLDNHPPQFSNLQRLTLRTWFSRGCMDAITYLFKISPNIESLSLEIHKIKFNSGCTEDHWEVGFSFPSMLYHLKFVEIRGLLGCVNELKFLEILLKNAFGLEKVVLFSSTSKKDSSNRERRMMKFSDKLLSFPRASASIAFMFRF